MICLCVKGAKNLLYLQSKNSIERGRNSYLKRLNKNITWSQRNLSLWQKFVSPNVEHSFDGLIGYIAWVKIKANWPSWPSAINEACFSIRTDPTNAKLFPQQKSRPFTGRFLSALRFRAIFKRLRAMYTTHYNLKSSDLHIAYHSELVGLLLRVAQCTKLPKNRTTMKRGQKTAKMLFG